MGTVLVFVSATIAPEAAVPISENGPVPDVEGSSATPTPENSDPKAEPKQKKPVSAARLRANRENAKKSTGAKTPEGKKRSSLNATRHGLLGQVITLPVEEQAAYDQFTEGYVQDLRPAGFLEKQLATTCADLQFRRLHRRLMQTLKELRSIQTERRQLEQTHLDAMAEMVITSPELIKDIHPRAFGFVCSEQQWEFHLNRTIALFPSAFRRRTAPIPA